jgi:mono/diheme cytochrome c family protein
MEGYAIIEPPMVGAAFGMIFGRVFLVNGNADAPVKGIKVGTREQDSENVSDNKRHGDTCAICHQNDMNSYEGAASTCNGDLQDQANTGRNGTRQKVVGRGESD